MWKNEYLSKHEAFEHTSKTQVWNNYKLQMEYLEHGTKNLTRTLCSQKNNICKQ